MTKSYRNVPELLLQSDPHQPVYCIFPHVYRNSTQEFLEGFPGRVLYAVKANNHPAVVEILHQSGVRHFDCASLQEVELVYTHCPDATIYFMNPVRFEGDARTAQQQYGVRHFVVDHESGLRPLLDEIDASKSVVFARMAVSHASAQADLSSKFGAPPPEVPELLDQIYRAGAEAALAFNVGSGVEDPAAYSYALDIANGVLNNTPRPIRLVDIGGGFPKSYPGLSVPPLGAFFERVTRSSRALPLADNGELLAEPGRALSAPGMSTISRVLLRKTDRIYLNDGLYGAFWELRFKAHLEYPCRVFRNAHLLQEETETFQVFGPTCDSTDQLPVRLTLPANIDVGDHIEFGNIGAYSLSGRTDFNGFYSDNVVSITDTDAVPPAI